MNFLRNSTIAKKHGTNPTTIANYIKASLKGKNDLKLVENNSKNYILDTEANHFEIQKLLEKGDKFKSNDERVVLEVGQEIYDVLNEEQVLSLYNELQTKSRIPMKFEYLDKGGEYWVKMYQETESKNNYSLTLPQKDLTSQAMQYLKPYFEDYEVINIIDIGATSLFQLSSVFEALKTKKVNYVPIDISEKVMNNAISEIKSVVNEKNIFPNKVDFETTSLQHILYKLKKDNPESLNLILFVGSSIGNFEPDQQIRILRNINDGMLKDDFLFITIGKDVLAERYNFSMKNNKYQILCCTFISTLLGFNQDNSRHEFTYNEVKKQREFNLVMKKDLVINFKPINKSFTIRKDKKINLLIVVKDTFDDISYKIKSSGMELKYMANHKTEPCIGYLAQLTE